MRRTLSFIAQRLRLFKIHTLSAAPLNYPQHCKHTLSAKYPQRVQSMSPKRERITSFPNFLKQYARRKPATAAYFKLKSRCRPNLTCAQCPHSQCRLYNARRRLTLNAACRRSIQCMKHCFRDNPLWTSHRL